MDLIDTHCHIADDAYAGIESEILTRADAAGVKKIVVIAVTPENAWKAEKLCLGPLDLTRRPPPRNSPKLYPTLGLHPHEAKLFSVEVAAELEENISRFVAVGECGLDWHYDLSPRDIQREAFDFQINLSITAKKPLVIHCRECAADIYEHLAKRRADLGPHPGIMHCFSETWEWGKKFLDLGFFLSFSGMLTFRSADAVREVAASAPADKILIETDAPYLAPVPHRGKQNEPAYITQTFQRLCEVRNTDPKEMAAQLWKNSHTVFNLS